MQTRSDRTHIEDRKLRGGALRQRAATASAVQLHNTNLITLNRVGRSLKQKGSFYHYLLAQTT